MWVNVRSQNGHLRSSPQALATTPSNVGSNRGTSLTSITGQTVRIWEGRTQATNNLDDSLIQIQRDDPRVAQPDWIAVGAKAADPVVRLAAASCIGLMVARGPAELAAFVYSTANAATSRREPKTARQQSKRLTGYGRCIRKFVETKDGNRLLVGVWKGQQAV